MQKVLYVSIPVLQDGIGDLFHGLNTLPMLKELDGFFENIFIGIYIDDEQFKSYEKLIASHIEKASEQLCSSSLICKNFSFLHSTVQDRYVKLAHQTSEFLTEYKVQRLDMIIEISYTLFTQEAFAQSLHLWDQKTYFFNICEILDEPYGMDIEAHTLSSTSLHEPKESFFCLGPREKQLGFFFDAYLKKSIAQIDSGTYTKSLEYDNYQLVIVGSALTNHAGTYCLYQKLFKFCSDLEDDSLSFLITLSGIKPEYANDKHNLLTFSDEKYGLTSAYCLSEEYCKKTNSFDLSVIEKCFEQKTKVLYCADRLAETEHKKRLLMPALDSSENRIYLGIIGGDNMFSEMLLLSTKSLIIPIFCFPGHKDDFLFQYHQDFEQSSFQALKRYSQYVLKQDRYRGLNDHPELDYLFSLISSKSINELKHLALDWQRYSQEMVAQKNASVIISKKFQEYARQFQDSQKKDNGSDSLKFSQANPQDKTLSSSSQSFDKPSS